jgi:hypothetical protein
MMEGLLKEHVRKLGQICRICGDKLKSRKSNFKYQYKKEVFKEHKELYGIYVEMKFILNLF